MRESLRNLMLETTLISAALIGCRSGKVSEVEQQPDFSQYVPIVVAIDSSPFTCFDEASPLVYRVGEKMEFYSIGSRKESELVAFEIGVLGNDALFTREGSDITAGVPEGRVFGILDDPEGRGANPFAKITEVSADYISIALQTECETHT